MRNSVVAIGILVAGAAGFGAGYVLRGTGPSDGAASAAEPAVATWRGGQLSVAEVRERLAAHVRVTGAAGVDAPRLRALVDAAVRDAVLAHEAERRGIAKDGIVAAEIRALTARRLIEKDFDQNPAAVDEAELRAYYDTHLADFVRPERVRVSHVALKKKQDAEKLRAQLAALPATDFEAFAKKANATDLGPLSKPEMVEKLGSEFTDVAWLMVKIGEVSKVIQTPEGFHVAKLHGREGATEQTFDQAREQLRSRLWYERRSAALEKFIGELEKSLALQVDRGEIDRLVAELAPNTAGR